MRGLTGLVARAALSIEVSVTVVVGEYLHVSQASDAGGYQGGGEASAGLWAGRRKCQCGGSWSRR